MDLTSIQNSEKRRVNFNITEEEKQKLEMVVKQKNTTKTLFFTEYINRSFEEVKEN